MKNRYNLIFFLHDKTKKQDIFLYGISLPTNCEIQNFSFRNNLLFTKKSICGGNKELLVFRNTIINYEFDNEISIAEIYGIIKDIPNIKIINKQEVIRTYSDYENKTPESLLKLPIKVDICYTNDFFNYYKNIEGNLEEINIILKFLNENTGLSFIDGNKNLYSKCLGCFEYIKEIPEFIEETGKIFEVKCEWTDNERKTRKFSFQKLQKYKKPISIILTVYNDFGDIIFCQKKDVKIREDKVYFDKEFQNDCVASKEYQIFDHRGELIDSYKCAFLKRIDFNMNCQLGSGTEIVFDKINYTKNSIFKNSEQIVNSRTGTVENFSTVDFDDNKAYNDLINRTNRFYNELSGYLRANKENTGIFIDKNLNNEEKVKQIQNFLFKIIPKDDCILSVFDPYFGITNDKDKQEITGNSFELFFVLPKNVKLRIYSCSGLELAKNNLINKYLNNFKEHNLAIGDAECFDLKEGIFHDRYIKVENIKTNNISIYMVSNSFNSLLHTYPICIIELYGNTKERVLNYLDTLKTLTTRQEKC